MEMPSSVTYYSSQNELLQKPETGILCLTFTLFIVVFLAHLPFIFQGVDVTDTGWSLSNQVEAFSLHINPDRIYPLIFLSDFFGGMWLSVIQRPSLLWARIGGILLYSMNALIVFFIASHYFDRHKSFLVVFISSFFINMRYGIDIINYNTFPTFLLTAELWLFNKSMTALAGTMRADVFGFLIGLLAVPVILSKVSLATVIICPAILLITCLFLRRDRAFRAIRLLLMSFLGFLLSAAVMAFMYWYLGLLQHGPMGLFAESIKTLTVKGTHHDLNSLTTLYESHLKILTASLKHYMVLTIVLIIIGLCVGRKLAIALFVCIPVVLTVKQLFQLTGWEYEMVAYKIHMIAAGISLILSSLFLVLDKGVTGKLNLLLIAGISIMVITPIGSNRGLLNIGFGMWLILPLSFLCMDKWLECNNDTPLSIVRTYNNSMLTVAMMLAVMFHFTNIYRDNPNRLALTVPFSHSALAGIFSTPQRVRAVDEVLEAIGRNTIKNEEVIMANNLPLFYYLTGTKPAMDNAWLFLDNVDMIRQRQQKLLDEKRLPRIFVLSKTDTRVEPKWPVTKSESNSTDKDKLAYMKEEYINNLGYKLIWENSAFALYRIQASRPPLLQSKRSERG